MLVLKSVSLGYGEVRALVIVSQESWLAEGDFFNVI